MLPNDSKSTNPQDEFRQDIRKSNLQDLETDIAGLMRHFDSVNSCFETTQNLLRAAMIAMRVDELDDEDLCAVNEIIMLCAVATRIGYGRYLVQDAA